MYILATFSFTNVCRSGSMNGGDRRPLPSTPVTTNIQRASNNRLGAVYSALHAFWMSRHAAVTANRQTRVANRRDSYSVVLFDHHIVRGVTNDLTSSPEDLLNGLLQYQARGGTDYDLALSDAQNVMTESWSPERCAGNCQRIVVVLKRCTQISCRHISV